VQIKSPFAVTASGYLRNLGLYVPNEEKTELCLLRRCSWTWNCFNICWWINSLPSAEAFFLF